MSTTLGYTVNGPAETTAQPADDASFWDRFISVADRYSSRFAITDRSGSLTYGELFALVRRIASAINAAAVERSGTVAILLPHEARFPAAIVATLAAGRGCVPLAADDPDERKRMIAADALASVVVSAGEIADRARQLFPDLPVIDIETIPRNMMQGPRFRPTGSDLAYIIYTSGSTGKPKGVYQNQRGLLDDLQRAADSLQLTCDDRQALFYPPSLISGFRVALGSLLSGGSLHILSPRELGPSGLAHAVRSQRITIFRAVPTLFRHVVETLSLDERLDSLRIVLLGGDRIDWEDFDAFRRGCSPNCLFGTHLGATETSTLYLQWFVDAGLRPSSPRLPVGRIMPGRHVMLMDDSGSPVADGEIGEFYVSGRHLALGYWRAPDLTARAFIADSTNPELRTYKTGDLGRKRPDGLYEFVGRKDQQIKLNGNRIELGEVECAIKACSESVRDAAIVVRRSEAGVPRALVAYIELDAETPPLQPRELTVMVADRIPRHMVPSSMIIVRELPRLPNLKIDRIQLAKMDAQQVAANAVAADDMPRTSLEAKLCAVYARVTNVARVGAHQSLFEIGGDSLTALLLMTELRQTLGYTISLGNIFDYSTPAALAEHLATEPPVALVDDKLPTVFVVPGADGGSPGLQRWRQRSADRVRLVILEFPDWSHLVTPGYHWREFLANLMKQVEDVSGSGPIFLAGYSSGGLVAYDLARALTAANREIGLLAVIDTDAAHSLQMPDDDNVSLSLTGAFRVLHWEIARMFREDQRGRFFENLYFTVIHFLMFFLVHQSLLRWFKKFRRLHLPTRARYLLHKRICDTLYARYTNAWPHISAPGPLEAPVGVFICGDADPDGRRAFDLGWSRHCRAPRFVEVAGDHWTILDEPQLSALCRAFADMVTAAARQTDEKLGL